MTSPDGHGGTGAHSSRLCARFTGFPTVLGHDGNVKFAVLEKGDSIMKLRSILRLTQLLFALLLALTPVLSLGTASVAAAAGPTITATKSDGVAAGVKKLAGDTVTYSVAVANTGSSDATGVSLNDPLDTNTTYVPGSLESTPIARNDSYHATGNIRIQVPISSGVLANDSDPDGDTLSVTSTSTPATTHGGNLTLNPDGSFTYN